MRVGVFFGLLPALIVGVLFAFVPPATSAVRVVGAAGPVETVGTETSEPSSTRPPVTANDFLPVDRGLGECISAIPKPGCGSEARGGWRQSLVLMAILAGLALITWRIVVTARTARKRQASRP